MTVEAARSSATTAALREWRWASTRYAPVGRAVRVFVGYDGVGPTREGLGRTPVGVFTLTQAFGNRPNDGTRLPYRLVGPDDWWDENPDSPAYNRLVVSPVSPGGASENLYDVGPAYAHAVVINYNTHPVVPGAGSGFFLHVSMGTPTAGCVALAPAVLERLMRWLDPSADPAISIGVGASALRPLAAAAARAR